MKIRTDFVTNSSSSSYVVIIEKDKYDEALAQEKSEITKQLLAFLEPRNEKFGAMEVMVLSYMEGNYSTFEEICFDEDTVTEDEVERYNDYGAGEYLGEFFSKVEKLGGGVIKGGVDC